MNGGRARLARSPLCAVAAVASRLPVVVTQRPPLPQDGAGMWPAAYAVGLTSTSMLRTAGSSRWSSSHCGPTRTRCLVGCVASCVGVLIAYLLGWADWLTAGLRDGRCKNLGIGAAPGAGSARVIDRAQSANSHLAGTAAILGLVDDAKERTMKSQEAPITTATLPGEVPTPDTFWPRVRRVLSKKLTWAVAVVVMIAIVGVTVLLGGSNSSSGATTATGARPAVGAGAGGAPAGGGTGGAGSNARSGPEPGGSIGTVSTVSTSGFTLSTATGEKVTVTEGSSTTYKNGTTATTPSAIKTGSSVLVLGTVNSTTITATQVVVEPAGTGGSSAASAAGVVAFQQGAPSTAKSVGSPPTDYTEGSGTIVTGTTANQATEVALAAYPGGIVDRVVKLADGDYEVHYIGVNWPHHVFVSSTFTVVGAD
jgi:hypothetical protein